MKPKRWAMIAAIFLLPGCEPEAAPEAGGTGATDVDTLVVGAAPPAPLPVQMSAPPTLVSCPGTGLPSRQDTVAPGSGTHTMTVGGQQFSFARNAIRDTVVLRMDVPESQYMEVVVTPVPDTAVVFNPAATIRINANRCNSVPPTATILQRDRNGEQLLPANGSGLIFEAPVQSLSVFLLATP